VFRPHQSSSRPSFYLLRKQYQQLYPDHNLLKVLHR